MIRSDMTFEMYSELDCGLQAAMLTDMTVVLLGVIMLTVSNGTSEQVWFAFGCNLLLNMHLALLFSS